MLRKGVVAAGHPLTAKAAITMLEEGGNAFDAAVAAHLAACVTEPVLCSLAGGGFMLGFPTGKNPCVYDFFVQTPKFRRSAEETDFHPISADFGPATQEFHIGAGSIATPGTVRGLFKIHRELCSLPMPVLAEPAISFARDGLRINAFQSYIFEIVAAIYQATPDAKNVYGSREISGSPIKVGELHRQLALADCLDCLSREGQDLFYRGEIAQKIVQLCIENGGHLTGDDLNAFRVIKRSPLSIVYRDAEILTNPPLSSGGLLIAFALELLQSVHLREYSFGSAEYLRVLAKAQKLTNRARLEMHIGDLGSSPENELFARAFLDRYIKEIKDASWCSRGTTHISVIDSEGNIASLTTSNGEGCGHMVPGTGIMLNNMLGEEDLNPGGFHRWSTDQRMTSMMAPTLAFLSNGVRIATGSGGSNRLRTAILQVLVNLVDYGMPIEKAVTHPRIHYEQGVLNLEPGFGFDDMEGLAQEFKNQKRWQEENLFFGGAHSVAVDGSKFSGAGDPRRGGVTISC